MVTDISKGMEAKINVYETSVSVYQSTLRHIKKDSKLQLSIFGRHYFATQNGKVPAFFTEYFHEFVPI
jgi:hypothetical protein